MEGCNILLQPFHFWLTAREATGLELAVAQDKLHGYRVLPKVLYAPYKDQIVLSDEIETLATECRQLKEARSDGGTALLYRSCWMCARLPGVSVRNLPQFRL